MTDLDIRQIRKLIGYKFRDRHLLEKAFCHKSFDIHYNNERLEFFGDSLLNFLVAQHLFVLSRDSEGRLTEMRKGYVSELPLANAVDRLGIAEYLIFNTSQPISTSMKSDLFEALVAAIYFDGGMKHAQAFVKRALINTDIDIDAMTDYKSRLQELVQRKKLGTITYVATGGDPTWSSTVNIGGQAFGKGAGKRKKEAEQIAARRAIQSLNDDQNPSSKNKT